MESSNETPVTEKISLQVDLSSSVPSEEARDQRLYFSVPPSCPPPDKTQRCFSGDIPVSSITSPVEATATRGTLTSTIDRGAEENQISDCQGKHNEKSEYSYAYYEPGVPTNAMTSQFDSNRSSKHTFTTRYGTEENIYEEINEVTSRWPQRQGSFSFDHSTSGLEEEVRRVQWRHHRVLDELNLAVEAMLMPASRDGDIPSTPSGPPDLLHDFLVNVRPTDELLSPSVTTTERNMSPQISEHNSDAPSSLTTSLPSQSNKQPPTLESRSRSSNSLWSRCVWKRFPVLGNVKSPMKHESRHRADSCNERCDGNTTRRRTEEEYDTYIERELSWDSGSDQEISEDENDVGSISITKNHGQLHSTLIKARTLCDKWRGGKPADIPANVIHPAEISGNCAGGQRRLSRWFSMRRGSHQYDMDGALERINCGSDGKMPFLVEVKQISAHDRLSFFGLMVKPVQRFPQFILFLQDLLKHTSHGHHDRMCLQLALTQLESLAEMLNERKREAEQLQACKEMLRRISGKFAAKSRSGFQRYLLREDDVTQLEFNQNGMITKAKHRRLLLLNDLVVCVSVGPKPDDFSCVERLSLKWTNCVSDIEVVDTSTSPTLSRLLTSYSSRGNSLKLERNTSSVGSISIDTTGVDSTCVEMNNLMHDYEVVSRIAELVSTLRGTYKDLGVESTRRLQNSIQRSIQQKDEEIAWADSCCLQIAVRGKSSREEIYTFQTRNPSVKKEWITELRLAQLALDPKNAPAWEVPEQERRPSTKMPLFVKAQSVYRSQHQTEVQCGCYYTITCSGMNKRQSRTNSYLWVCTSDGASSHIAILAQPSQQQAQLRHVSSFDLVETRVSAMEYVRGTSTTGHDLSNDTVWMGTDSRRIFIFAAIDPEYHRKIGSSVVSASIIQIRSHCDCVFVALADGSLLLYRRQLSDSAWSLDKPISCVLGSEPVSSLLPINTALYAACGRMVWVLDGANGEMQKNFSVQHEHLGSVNLMAHSGIGLWISLKNSSTICLYHIETFKHLQDINIASNVLRVTSSSKGNTSNSDSRYCLNNSSAVSVTSLMACKGLLWVGTNVGISLTIPLPRLEGVPIISGRVNISYHAHFGPIHFLLTLQPRSTNSYYSWKQQEEVKSKDDVKNVMDTTISSNDSKVSNIKEESKLSHNSINKSVSAKLKQNLISGPVVLRKRTSKGIDFTTRVSKTLPRGLGCGIDRLSTSTTSSQGSDTCDVYGLYGELMYVKDYEGEENALHGGTDPIYESLHHSDPELAAIPGKVSTLDRRLKLKVSRPRSLDLSNWSVDSKSSKYTSSDSEETSSQKDSTGSVSRYESPLCASAEENDVKECVDLMPGTQVTKHAQKFEKNVQASSSTDSSRRTIVTLMGGRGYVNWRHTCCPDDCKNSKTSSPISLDVPNSTDAHIVIWEMKL